MFADYPGIIEDPAHAVRGTYATGLTEANMRRLDLFEGGRYVRKKVKVNLLTKVGNDKGEGNVEGEEKVAEVYVFKKRDDLEDKEWDLEEFRREKMHLWTREGYVFEGKNIREPPSAELDVSNLNSLPQIAIPTTWQLFHSRDDEDVEH
jgi:hypothetical protein